MTKPQHPRVLAWCVLPILATAGLADPVAAQSDRPETNRSSRLEVLVLDRDGEPVPGLTDRDFVITRNGDNFAVAAVGDQFAGEAPRRFVFVFNRRGADAAQLNRALRGLKSFIEERMFDSDESLFADLGETLRIGRAFAPGKRVALGGLETVPAMGYRSPAGAEDDAVVASRMLEMVADRLAATSGRKILVLFSDSIRSLSSVAEQAGTRWTANFSRTRIDPRGSLNAGLDSITERLHAAGVTVHVLHLAGVRKFENSVLISNPGDYYTDSRGQTRRSVSPPTGYIYSSGRAQGATSPTRDQMTRERAGSPRSGDDILSSLAAETGGFYFARATGFRRPLDRIAARNQRWYRLSLVGEQDAAERQSGVPQVLVPACSDCTVLQATNPE